MIILNELVFRRISHISQIYIGDVSQNSAAIITNSILYREDLFLHVVVEIINQKYTFGILKRNSNDSLNLDIEQVNRTIVNIIHNNKLSISNEFNSEHTSYSLDENNSYKHFYCPHTAIIRPKTRLKFNVK